MKTKSITLILAALISASTAIYAETGHENHNHADHSTKSETTAIDAAHVVKEIGKYPLAVCPVTGEPLGSMGKPYIYKHEGREVRFCCKGCVDKLTAEPSKYLSKLDAAVIAQQKDAYPLDYCVVSLDPLEESETIDYVASNNRLFRLCCKMCKKELEENLEKFSKELDKARKS